MTVVYDYDELGRPIVNGLEHECSLMWRDEVERSRASGTVSPYIHDYGIVTVVPKELGRLAKLARSIRIKRKDRRFVRIMSVVIRFVKIMDLRPRYLIIDECARFLKKNLRIIWRVASSVAYPRALRIMLIAALAVFVAARKLGVIVNIELLEDVSGVTVFEMYRLARRCGIDVPIENRWRRIANLIMSGISELGIRNVDVVKKAFEYAERIARSSYSTSRNIAAAAIYAALFYYGIETSMEEICRIVGGNPMSVRSLLKKHGVQLDLKKVGLTVATLPRYCLEVPQWLRDVVNVYV